MKNIIIIALFFVVSCQSDDKTIEYLNEGVNLGIDFMQNTNSDIYNYFEAAMHENPKATKKHKTIVDKVKLLSESLHLDIDSLINQVSNDKKTQRIENKLSKKLYIYQEYIDSLSNADTLLFKVTSKIKLQFGKININQLLLLKNKVSLLEKYVLDRQYDKIGGTKYHINKMKVGIAPNKFELKKNQVYKAEIKLLEYDSTFPFHVYLNNTKYQSKDGIVLYKDTNTANLGRVNERGNLIWINPYFKTEYKHQININYLIVKQ